MGRYLSRVSLGHDGGPTSPSALLELPYFRETARPRRRLPSLSRVLTLTTLDRRQALGPRPRAGGWIVDRGKLERSSARGVWCGPIPCWDEPIALDHVRPKQLAKPPDPADDGRTAFSANGALYRLVGYERVDPCSPATVDFVNPTNSSKTLEAP